MELTACIVTTVHREFTEFFNVKELPSPPVALLMNLLRNQATEQYAGVIVAEIIFQTFHSF